MTSTDRATLIVILSVVTLIAFIVVVVAVSDYATARLAADIILAECGQ
jgi:hypothetical protein